MLIKSIKPTLLVFCLLFSSISSASEPPNYNIRYHPKYTNIAIPENIDVKGKVTVDAPIGNYVQSPILTVYINDKGPYYFMVDTGWSGAMLSQRVAKQLKLPHAGTKQYNAITPSQVVEVIDDLYFVKKLTIGKVKLENYAINVSSGFEDDIQLFRRYGRNNEAGLDGVLGLNSFYGFMMTINYKNETISFQKDSLSREDKDVLPYGSEQATPNVNLKVNFERLGRSEVQNFTVDTGNSTYILMSACNIPEMSQFTGKDAMSTYDFAGNEVPQFYAKLYGNIEISPHYQIKEPYITFASTNCNFRPHGLLGRKFFDDNLVIIDPDDELIKIIKN